MSQTEKKNRLHQRNNPLTLNLGIPYPQASSLLEVGAGKPPSSYYPRRHVLWPIPHNPAA